MATTTHKAPGENGRVVAVIWDYDGTLVDTRAKNLAVTRMIVHRITGSDAEAFPALRSLEDYTRANRKWQNWREFYQHEFGLGEEEIDEAGRMWTDVQQEDETPTPMYEGLRDLILRQSSCPHGVVSQNSRHAITSALTHHGVLPRFHSIIGYEEVSLRSQKPDPAGLLRCIRELAGTQHGLALYIGDHDTDIRCALNAKRALQSDGNTMTVRSVGVSYSHDRDTVGWSLAPDFHVRTVPELAHLVRTMEHPEGEKP